MDPRLEYDLIIIGAGPSAAGLLHGILTRIKGKADKINDVRIAVVERGENVAGETPQCFQHGHASTIHLRDWFTAAHYSSFSGTKHPISSPTTLHTSTPQRHLHSRILDVPTGRGWGGSTNIHAGLLVTPSPKDFQSWPGTWKDRMIHAVHHVTSIFETEGAISKSPVEHVCSGKTSIVPDFEGAAFEQAITTSLQWKRINYFAALVQPLFRDFPEFRHLVTFLSGMEAQRILIDTENIENTTENSLSSCKGEKSRKPRAWGVECLVVSDFSAANNNAHRSTERHKRRHVILKSTCEIILCAGAIGSPSLLLVSGIGHTDDLKAAGIIPLFQHERESFDRDERTMTKLQLAKKIHYNLPVGRKLRDHVLLPRIFLTRKQTEAKMSSNSIRGWWTIKRHVGSDDDVSDNYAKFQLQLADGASIDKMMPHFAAAVIRRRWGFLNLRWGLHRAMLDHVFRIVRGTMHCVLNSRLFRSWFRLHFAFINVCLMNPKSVGKVSILPHRNEDEESRYDFSSSNSSVPRLRGFEVVIDPGYLSNPWDMIALWKGWEMSTALKNSQYEECTEVLPGFLFVVAFKIASILSLVLNWTRLFFFGNTGKPNFQSTVSSAPAWFCGYVAEFANPYYHWFGTCVMRPKKTNQNDDDFVVDEFLCVRGVSALRVCDSSVFPGCVSVPTALTCAALGSASSEFIVSLLNKKLLKDQL
ncbi:hypothetical protein ACHAWX_001546 [Stephanocyclus meneghinianus]